MLPLEAIAVLGLIYLFLMYAMLKAMRVKERERRRVQELPAKPIEQPEVA